MGTEHLLRAKRNIDDEFYTRYEDVEKEVLLYKDELKGKSIYCPCDNPMWSNFWKYLHKNFRALRLKKLTATHYSDTEAVYKAEYYGGNDDDTTDFIKTPLTQNGDFRSDECVEVLKAADVVITNPPFSLIKYFIPLVMKYEKKILMIAPPTSLGYFDVRQFVVYNKLWISKGHVKSFVRPDGTEKKMGNAIFVTNLKRLPKVPLEDKVDNEKRAYDVYVKFQRNAHNKYLSLNIININKIEEIPLDYKGVMGVPLSYLEYHNPEKYKIIDFVMPYIIKDGKIKALFIRILIQRIAD